MNPGTTELAEQYRPGTSGRGHYGVFEDFFIRPEFRHQGIARRLVQFAYQSSGVSTMTVDCADCDAQMYASLGFSVPLGRLLAFEAQ